MGPNESHLTECSDYAWPAGGRLHPLPVEALQSRIDRLTSTSQLRRSLTCSHSGIKHVVKLFFFCPRPAAPYGSQSCHFPFALSPISTSRRMASERLRSRFSPQSSISWVRSVARRTALTGSTPPAFFGRPRDFLFTEIDFFIFSVYRKSKPRGSANFRPGSNPSHERAKIHGQG
jgi:hypothetical protein